MLVGHIVGGFRKGVPLAKVGPKKKFISDIVCHHMTPTTQVQMWHHVQAFHASDTVPG